MKKTTLISALILVFSLELLAQKPATIKEYSQVFPTYPYSDPNPIPVMGKIYPYFRYDGFTINPVQKEWKVVEMENDYIKLMILPEVGGKIWSAIEKSSGRSFIYHNHVVKFRDIAMRGPWTSGGIEPNYGIIGHTPNCATPVDYVTMHKEDGSASCVIGVLDLLTRTSWRLEINLPNDKAYITTTSFWYNSTPFDQAYYTWMNTGLKAKGNLQFIFPGTHYLGHEGEYSDWPINKENGKDISFYENNNFGGPKSYHVFGKYTDFFGAYWHDEDFGMGRYSTHDDKAGKKIWIWGLSQQGMIWEKLLTDADGQYVEVQSGRFFNQADVGSTFTPFKHPGFLPYAAETWKEYWFPVQHTKGMVKANQYGALNIKKENGWLKIYFFPLQRINDDLKVFDGEKIIFSRPLQLSTSQKFCDSIKYQGESGTLKVKLGENKLLYDANPAADVLNRPLNAPKDFDWNSVFGLHTQAKENIHQRFYGKALEKLEACLKKDPNFLPALTDMAMLMLQSLRYQDAYHYASRALSINSYDAPANFYYGLANIQLGQTTNAIDGFDIASLSIDYRAAAFTELSKVYLREKNYDRALWYAKKTLDFSSFNLDAYQVIAVINRLQKQNEKEAEVLKRILEIDPLNHFVRSEKYLLENSDVSKKQFVSMIRNELPQETFLELATWYHQVGLDEDCATILGLATQTPEILYWQAYLHRETKEGAVLLQKARAASPVLSFPFRTESVPVLEWAMQNDSSWKPKYYLALIYWHTNNLEKARKLLEQCAMQPDYAPFYAARAALWSENEETPKMRDIEYAIQLDEQQWRYQKQLAENKIGQGKYEEARSIAGTYYRRHPEDYIMGMLYARTLLLTKQYKECDALLSKLTIIPFEGATDGRELYREAKLMQAVQEMKKKNYKAAIQFINASKLWPSNLGVGKPYDVDIDLRLEEWLNYMINSRLGKPALAQASLENIIKTNRPYPSANDLVTAWAMEKIRNKDDALKWLDDRITRYPESKILIWCKAVLQQQPTEQLLKGESNATIRILEALKQLEY